MTQPQGYVLTRDLPPIPAKRYFTIGEVSQLCDVRSYVLRYWEQEFVQLRPMKRRGNRRYYQLHEVQLVRKIRELLYEQGFTIAGARLQLEQKAAEDVMSFELSPPDVAASCVKGRQQKRNHVGINGCVHRRRPKHPHRARYPRAHASMGGAGGCIRYERRAGGIARDQCLAARINIFRKFA